MRRKPYARGGCHGRDYVGDTKLPTILVPDVARTDSISMPRIPTGWASKHAPLDLRLASLSTGRTRLARVSFLLQDDTHSQPLCFVGEQMPDVPG